MIIKIIAGHDVDDMAADPRYLEQMPEHPRHIENMLHGTAVEHQIVFVRNM